MSMGGILEKSATHKSNCGDLSLQDELLSLIRKE